MDKNMAKQKTINVWVDRLTNSIFNTISGDSLPTNVIAVAAQDLKLITKSRGWNFNWKGELKKDSTIVYKLTVVNNLDSYNVLLALKIKATTAL
jgi:hypothetical protein